MPPDKMFSSILELPPPDSGAPTEQIAQAELASMHRVEAGALQMGFWELPSSGRQRESFRVMAAACTTADADACLDIVESQGLDVIALDVQQTALGRLVAGRAQSPGIEAVLDLGWRSGLLVLMCRGVVIYERRLAEVGLEKLAKALTTTLEVDESVIDCLLNEVGLGAGAEQGADPLVVDEMHDAIREHYQGMVHELSVSFSYAGHQYPDAELKRLSLVGGGAGIPGLDAHLAEQLGLDVSVLRPTDVVQAPGGLNVIAANSNLCVAVALALHEEAR
jgi:Tfp pilus assembly PilM family ATPase